MKKPKYCTIVVTDFELRMLESLPEYSLRTSGKEWKALYVVKDRILKRNREQVRLANKRAAEIAASDPNDEPATTVFVKQDGTVGISK